MEAALRAGYRLIDCAHIYGNEAEVGEGLQKCFKEGVVKRALQSYGTYSYLGYL